MNKITPFLLGLILLVTAGCSGIVAESSNPDNSSQSETFSEETVSVDNTFQNGMYSVVNITEPEYDHDDLNDSNTSNDIALIEFAGDQIIYKGGGANIENDTITITSAGTFQISGRLDNGQVIVDTQDNQAVRLIFSGIDITCTTRAPIYIKNAVKTVITLVENTVNAITDGQDYILNESGEPNAAIFSMDDLTINGQGTLFVNGNYNHGIFSKDDLRIIDGDIAVYAVNDGIKGRDSIAIKDGQITIEAGGDGLQSNNDVDLEKGNIFIEGGSVVVNAGEDGIQAENTLIISGGEVTINTSSGSENASQRIEWKNWGQHEASTVEDTEGSAKGLKAGEILVITGGKLEIDSADDALHSNNTIIIDDGQINLASGDDAIHADSVLIINGGTVQVSTCYEGLESSAITINGGDIHIVAFDDGINAASGTGNPDQGLERGMGFTQPEEDMPERPDFSAPNQAMQNPPRQGMLGDGGNTLVINGGVIFIDATGDGIDINGSITMTDGTLLINGPSTNPDSALDYYDYFDISGGYLVAVGSAGGMAMAPSVSSSQYSVVVNLETIKDPGTLFHLVNQSGEEIFTFSSSRAYQSVIISSPELKDGTTYSIYIGGESTGFSSNGLFTDGIYLPGSKVDNFTISSMVTTVGDAGEMFFGGQGGQMPRRP